MAYRILVTSNCQTFGLAAALAAIFPFASVQGHAWPMDANVLAEHDIIVFDALNADGSEALARYRSARPDGRVVLFPRIRFSGFHPDLCYATCRSTGAYTTDHYNSSLAVWGYRAGRSAEETTSLFCDQSYGALGFYANFELAMQTLRQEFAGTDIDFARFFLPMKRQGVFMYSYNHPKPYVLDHLARLIAEVIEPGRTRGDAARNFGLNDGLNSEIWPLYPEIADQLALPEASYTWKIDNAFIEGVYRFVSKAFDGYAAQGIARDDLLPRLVNGIPEHRYDALVKARP